MRHVPFTNLSSDDEKYLEITKRVLNRGRFILDQEVQKFEEEFAEFVGVKYCVGVGNGFDALQIILRCLGVGRDDFVIVPSNAPLPVWMAVSSLGATPLPIDPSIHTYQIETLEHDLVDLFVRAAIVVHMYGTPVDLDKIPSIHIPVIEDCCQAHGAIYRGDHVGRIGIASAFSFYPTKNLGAYGDGGAVLTNDDKVADKAKSMRAYGDGRFVGINSRLDELQAAYLRAKLPSLSREVDRRLAKAVSYFAGLVGMKEVHPPVIPPGRFSSWHQFVIRCDHRDALRVFLRDNGIETMVHYPVPCFRMPVYEDIFDQNHYSVADELSNTVLSLPIGTGVTFDDVEYVCEKIKEFYG